MIDIVLPKMRFELREWQASDFDDIVAATEKISALKSKAGKGSDRFQNACRRLLKAAMTGPGFNYQEQIQEAIDARAFTYLLSNSEAFADRVAISRPLLDQLISVRSPISRLTLSQLIRAFFLHFDQLAKSDDLADWCHAITSSLSRYDTSKGSSELKTYAKLAPTLFTPLGPQRVVDYASKQSIDFDEAVHHFGLTGYANGRYLTLCRYQYYLKTLEDIPVGAADPVLAEICKSDVANSPYSDDKLLGHAILERLIDRTGNKAISQAWQTAILNIAGDPRVPKTHKNYQQWWQLLGPKRIALMRGWLSRFDLQLFLKILEQSAKDGSNSDMERMFTSRKIFMEGLLNQGLVSESRLFLSSAAIGYLRRHYERSELPDYAKVSSSNTSMIYLNLQHRVHVIEGSHLFKLQLMDKMPTATRVNDYAITRFGDPDLRKYIGPQYENEFPHRDGYRAFTHDIHLNWQHKSIQFLKENGIAVDVAKVIGKKRYRQFKEKFGVSF